MQEYYALSEQADLARGELLWKGAAVEYWQSKAGGDHTQEQAERKWQAGLLLQVGVQGFA